MGLSDKHKRFVKVYEEGSGMLSSFAIFIDRFTGVNYLMHMSGEHESMTPLLDPNGRPIVTPLYDMDNKR
ncbi:MAG: DUF6440 family protein [Ruminococcus sp.]|nr:DUF6440 family protein [Ruminococcus sp.]